MKNKEYYMSLKYPVILNEFNDDGDQTFSAEIKELPGLIVYGDSVEEVYEEIELAKSDWIDANLEWGREILEPSAEDLEEYSGRITLRIAKTLHKSLKKHSLIEGVSLNQTIVQLINDGFIYQNTPNSNEKLELIIPKSSSLTVNKTNFTKNFQTEVSKGGDKAPWPRAINLNVKTTGENQ